VNGIRFEWDEAKNRSNQRKHGVSFEFASLVFEDPLRISVLERVVDHEQRWQTFGVVEGQFLLMVAHTALDEQDIGVWVEVIRIISARYAEPIERRRYESGNR
jgi:uncharacterized DUF497 family protein